MLDGDNDAIHSSTIAQQPQVWSISEHHSLPSSSRSIPSTIETSGTNASGLPTRRQIPPGSSLTGYLPPEVEFDLLKRPTVASTSPTSPTRNSRKSKEKATTDLGTSSVHASFVDPITGLKVDAEYETWDEALVAQRKAAASALPTSSYRSPQVSINPSFPNPPKVKREPYQTSSYPDPYGLSGPGHVSSPGSSRENSHPNSSRTSFDGSAPHHPHPGRSGGAVSLMTTLSQNQTQDVPGDGAGEAAMDAGDKGVDEEPADIVLTGKVCHQTRAWPSSSSYRVSS